MLFRSCNTLELQNYLDHTLHLNNHAPVHKSKQLINKSCKYIVISGLMILTYHCIHVCIIISDIPINYSPYHGNIHHIEVFIHYTHLCTLSTLIFTSLYSLSLNQYHKPNVIFQIWNFIQQ